MRRHVQHSRPNQIPTHPSAMQDDPSRWQVDARGETTGSYKNSQNTLVVRLRDQVSLLGSQSSI